MNAQGRELFWKTLCALPGLDPKQDAKKLVEVIAYPKYLYRYRTVTMNSLEALRTNKLYFSTANYYDDLFDTFLHINIDTMREEFLSAFQTNESMEAVAAGVQEIFGDTLTEEQRKLFTVDGILGMLSYGLTEYFLAFALASRDGVKKDTWSVCFSENGINEALWLKYADRHKGFVQIYDLENNENLLCGKQEKCQNCGIRTFGTPLYPVYYSNTPYDATNFTKFVMLNKLSKYPGVQIPQWLYDSLGNGAWERERTTLIKKKCHEYDEEWRIITGCQMSSPVMMEWVPSGIILGLRMENEEEHLVISVAKEAGIKDIYKSYIDLNNTLNIKRVSFD